MSIPVISLHFIWQVCALTTLVIFYIHEL